MLQPVTGNFLFKLVNPPGPDLQKLIINGRAVFTFIVYDVKKQMSNLIDLCFAFFDAMVYEYKYLHSIICFTNWDELAIIYTGLCLLCMSPGSQIIKRSLAEEGRVSGKPYARRERRSWMLFVLILEVYI